MSAVRGASLGPDDDGTCPHGEPRSSSAPTMNHALTSGNNMRNVAPVTLNRASPDGSALEHHHHTMLCPGARTACWQPRAPRGCPPPLPHSPGATEAFVNGGASSSPPVSRTAPRPRWPLRRVRATHQHPPEGSWSGFRPGFSYPAEDGFDAAHPLPGAVCVAGCRGVMCAVTGGNVVRVDLCPSADPPSGRGAARSSVSSPLVGTHAGPVIPP